MDSRYAFMEAWLQSIGSKHKLLSTKPEVASNDASFRRYFRVACEGLEQSLIVMDAPKDGPRTAPRRKRGAPDAPPPTTRKPTGNGVGSRRDREYDEKGRMKRRLKK